MIIIVIFGVHYAYLQAKDCQILPKQYSDIAQAISGNPCHSGKYA